MKIQILYILMILSFSIIACEDTIDVKLKEAEPVLVVDAWITNQPEDQVISLTKTQPYFEQQVPPAVSGANVTVTDNEGKVYVFDEQEPGEYVWSPEVGTLRFGKRGNTYTLNVEVDGQSYLSTTQMGRAPQIDSVTFSFTEESAFFPESYIAQFWARDFEGHGDTYWIRAYKNGVLLNRPDEINIAYDAAFGGGENVDGITFIQPIRQGINPFEEDDDNSFLPPYEPGDSVYVEIHSISNEAFYFLNEVVIQTDRPGGFAELFAQPVSNIPTNIRPVDNSQQMQVVGFFNVAEVKGLGQKLEE